MYEPHVIDTSEVKVSGEIEKLAELLARNTHEVWSLGRMQDGWTYGEKRDDAAKTHPCLVPYEQLPESEKEYDRSTSMETLKVILKLGFTIEKKTPSNL